MKKIMFNDRYGLTQAVLEGRKTMTRRIIGEDIEVDWVRRGKVHIPIVGYKHRMLWMDCTEFLPDSGKFDYVAPQKYQPAYDWDEEVAIAQSYRDIFDEACAKDYWDDIYAAFRNALVSDKPGWRNKMFVRADLMPHSIRITNIKAERLQDISEEDAMREGIRQCVVEYGDKKIVQWTYFGEKITTWFDSPREAFAALIDRISGKGTWQRNPWVFAYTFELIQ